VAADMRYFTEVLYRVENLLIRPGVLEHFMGRQDF
jgi:hypothetical protein